MFLKCEVLHFLQENARRSFWLIIQKRSLADGWRRFVSLDVGAVNCFVKRWALGDEQDIIAHRKGGDGKDEQERFHWWCVNTLSQSQKQVKRRK